MRLGLVTLLLLETDLSDELGQKNPSQAGNLTLPGPRRTESFPRCSDAALQLPLLLCREGGRIYACPQRGVRREGNAFEEKSIMALGWGP